jgi:4-diphosphocytidyl-2-C-methyl-D-erythritol kinase
MNFISLDAPAKINLTLDVGLRRSDGYHDIRSVMQTIALHDTLDIALTPDRPGIFLEVAGEESSGVPADETNLVHKAAVRLQKVAAARSILTGHHGLHICLHKCIPSQAGLGGGSSDAAAALLAVNALLGLGLSPRRLGEIGASLGADVPFFLTGGTALAEGLGEKITPLPPLMPDWPLVVVKPSAGVSTAAAYAALDAVIDRRGGDATERWLGGTQTLHNDFEAVVLPAYPDVAAAYTHLSQTAEHSKSFKPLLCGSGSALFLRASSPSASEDMAAQIKIAAQIKSAGLGKVWATHTRGARSSG